MCLFKFANIYTIPERIKKGVWKNKKKAVCKCFIFSLPFPKAALVSAEIRKEYIEVVLALPMCFWAVAQCRWVWVEMPQRGQHSHFLNDLVKDLLIFSVLEFQSASKKRSSGMPFPELCTPLVSQNYAMLWIWQRYQPVPGCAEHLSPHTQTQHYFRISADKITGKEVHDAAQADYSQRCNSSRTHSTSLKTSLQNSVCLNLQLMDLETAGRNTLFYWH